MNRVHCRILAKTIEGTDKDCRSKKTKTINRNKKIFFTVKSIIKRDSLPHFHRTVGKTSLGSFSTIQEIFRSILPCPFALLPRKFFPSALQYRKNLEQPKIP